MSVDSFYICHNCISFYHTYHCCMRLHVRGLFLFLTHHLHVYRVANTTTCTFMSVDSFYIWRGHTNLWHIHMTYTYVNKFTRTSSTFNVDIHVDIGIDTNIDVFCLCVHGFLLHLTWTYKSVTYTHDIYICQQIHSDFVYIWCGHTYRYRYKYENRCILSVRAWMHSTFDVDI